MIKNDDLELQMQRLDLTATPPTEEPQRQYFYMAKAKKMVGELTARLGRKPTFCVTTFGCQMNARDSEKLSGILEQIGYVDNGTDEKSDFVIYNTCTVRDNANQRVYGRLGALSNYKKKNPDMRIALCGCMMQEQSVIDKLKKSYRFVDLIFGTHNIFKFAELVCDMLENDDMIVDIWEGTDQIVEDLPIVRKYPFKSGINIMFGCNNFCSYCIVPYVRGRERSRTPEDIIREIEMLVEDGVIEIMLLGQNVNSYGKTLENSISFAELLQRIEKIEGLERIRFMTSHPKDLSDELIQVMRDSKKICRHLHLPLQSGSTRILERMNRRYTKEQYVELALKIRREIPFVVIVKVGFFQGRGRVRTHEIGSKIRLFLALFLRFGLNLIRTIFIGTLHAAAIGFHERFAAFGASLARGDIPAHKLTFTEHRTAIIHLAFFGLPLRHSVTTFGAFPNQFHLRFINHG